VRVAAKDVRRYGLDVLRSLLVVCVLAALGVAVAATLDHRHKQRVEGNAQIDAWFCVHGKPARCRDFDLEDYERRWEQRELAYETGFFALGGAALLLAGAAFVRART
jgi:hypothetical protein